MAGQRPNRDGCVPVADERELAEPADVDEDFRHGEPQLHEREQRMPAGQELRVVAALAGQLQGLVHRPGPAVSEGCRDHRCSIPSMASAAASTARTMLW